MKTLFVAVLLAAVPAPTAAAPHLGPEGQPNVVVVLIDCLRADHVGVNGAARPATPNIDALAAEGVNFRHAYAQATWTRPSVPSLLTGLYPSEHGLIAFEQTVTDKTEGAKLSDDVVTLAEVLKASGYSTALIADQYQLAPQFNLTQGFDHYDNKAGPAPRLNRDFLHWVDGLESGPFFAYLHYLDIHWPYCPPPAVRRVFDAGKSSLNFCQNWRGLRDDINAGKVQLSSDDRQAMSARYDEELLDLDARLGELFRELKERDLWDQTLVVVTADHGEEFMEHGAVGHGQSLYDELMHVPFVVKPPSSWRAPRGASRDGLMETRSLVPTLVAAAGASIIPRYEAPSLLPWLRATPPAAPASFVVAEEGEGVALRTETWKLIRDAPGAEDRLYDLVADPGETKNVAAANPAELASLRTKLQRWREDRRPSAAEPMVLDSEVDKGLKALGYITGGK